MTPILDSFVKEGNVVATNYSLVRTFLADDASKCLGLAASARGKLGENDLSHDDLVLEQHVREEVTA